MKRSTKYVVNVGSALFVGGRPTGSGYCRLVGGYDMTQCRERKLVFTYRERASNAGSVDTPRTAVSLCVKGEDEDEKTTMSSRSVVGWKSFCSRGW